MIDNTEQHPLAAAIAEICDECGATGITCYPMQGETRIADEIVIATAMSERILDSLTEKIREYLKNHHRLPIHGVPRQDRSGWVAIDCGDVVVHLFTHEQREHYDLDSLYTPPSPHLTPRKVGGEVDIKSTP